MNHFLTCFQIFLLLLDLEKNQLSQFKTRFNEMAFKDHVRKLDLTQFVSVCLGQDQVRKLEVPLTRQLEMRELTLTLFFLSRLN